MNVWRKEVEIWEDVLAFRNEVRNLIKSTKLNDSKKENFLLAFTELGNNLLAHSDGGLIEIILEEDFLSIRTQSKKIEKKEKKSSLGIGLLSVRDIMDELTIKNYPQEYEVVAKMRLDF